MKDRMKDYVEMVRANYHGDGDYQWDWLALFEALG